MKTMRQPKKDVLREQLALAAEEIIQLRGEVATRDLLLEAMSRKYLAPLVAPPAGVGVWRFVLDEAFIIGVFMLAGVSAAIGLRITGLLVGLVGLALFLVVYVSERLDE